MMLFIGRRTKHSYSYGGERSREDAPITYRIWCDPHAPSILQKDRYGTVGTVPYSPTAPAPYQIITSYSR